LQIKPIKKEIKGSIIMKTKMRLTIVALSILFSMGSYAENCGENLDSTEYSIGDTKSIHFPLSPSEDELSEYMETQLPALPVGMKWVYQPTDSPTFPAKYLFVVMCEYSFGDTESIHFPLSPSEEELSEYMETQLPALPAGRMWKYQPSDSPTFPAEYIFVVTSMFSMD